MLHSEKEVLEEAAANANARMQENREALAAQTKQLGQLQYLPPRLQDMQEQVCTFEESEGVHLALIALDHGSLSQIQL